MNKYLVDVTRHYSYKVVVEAKDEWQAREIVRDYDIEDLEPFEVDSWFDFEEGELLSDA